MLFSACWAWSRGYFVIEEEVIGVCQVLRVLVLAAGVLVFQFVPESAVPALVASFEETHGDGLQFGAGQSSLLQFVGGDGGRKGSLELFLNGRKVRSFGSYGRSVMLEDLYQRLVLFQIVVQSLMRGLLGGKRNSCTRRHQVK
jgi:hypothetical protein